MRSWKTGKKPFAKLPLAKIIVFSAVLIFFLYGLSLQHFEKPSRLSLATNTPTRLLLDATNVEVNIPFSPKRIVTLAPSLGEVVAEILGDDFQKYLVGVSESSDFPPALKKIASVGPFHQFNLEKVLSLKPDLVFATKDGNRKDQVLHLRELGIPVITVSTSHFKLIEESMRLIGEALGRSKAGIAMAEQLNDGRQKFLNKPRTPARPRILIQLSDDPLVVVGQNTFLQEAVQILGAINVYQNSDVPYPHPSIEDVIVKNPDIIIILAMGEDAKPFQSMARKWADFPQLEAIQHKKVRLIQSDALVRPTLRILEGLKILEKAIYD